MAERAAPERQAKQGDTARGSRRGGGAPGGAPAPAPALAELLSLQRAVGNRAVARLVSDSGGSTPDRSGLPAGLRSGVEALSGMSMDGVTVHYDSHRPAEMSARAFAEGSDIHVAPGEERHLPHEAWHVVQQAQGRVGPTIQPKDGVGINIDGGLEREADAMGAKAEAVGGAPVARQVALRDRLPSVGSARRVIQAWWDNWGKWRDGPLPDKAQWEEFKDSKGRNAYRPIKDTEQWKADQAKIELEKAEKERAATEKAEKEAAKLAEWKRLDAKRKDERPIFLENPGEIFYTQDSIDYYFQDGGTTDTLIDQLKTKKKTADNVEPIMVQLWEGGLWSYDNRRLYCFKQAGVQIRCRFMTDSEIANNKGKLTGTGTSMRVRNKPQQPKKTGGGGKPQPKKTGGGKPPK